MSGWRVPKRDDLLPIAPQQSCAVCGEEGWRHVYLLLNAPDWVQALPWVINWFVVLCGPCHDRFQAGDDSALAAKRDGPILEGRSGADFLELMRARLSEPPLTREAAQQAE